VRDSQARTPAERKVERNGIGWRDGLKTRKKRNKKCCTLPHADEPLRVVVGWSSGRLWWSTVFRTAVRVNGSCLPC
jgi:hypothetical protein